MRALAWAGAFFLGVEALASSVGVFSVPNGSLAARLGPGGCKSSQSCIYQRANEVLSLQAFYLSEKTTRIFKFFETSRSLPTELDAFCKAQARGPSGGRSSDKECLKSYLLQVRRGMQQLRTAIVRNEDMLFKIANKKGAVAQAPVIGEPPEASPGVAGIDGPGANRPWQTRFDEQVRTDAPFIPSLPLLKDAFLDSMENAFKARSANPQEQQVMDNELGGWWDSYPKCPDKDEFILVEMVERFPSRPTGELLRRVKTNPDGSVAWDEKAFQSARAECERARQDWVRQAPFASQQAAQSAARARANPKAPDLLVGKSSVESNFDFASVQQFVVDCTSGKLSADQCQGAGARGGGAAGGGSTGGRKRSGFFLQDAFFTGFDTKLAAMLSAL
jgi:hypothetical protein